MTVRRLKFHTWLSLTSWPIDYSQCQPGTATTSVSVASTPASGTSTASSPSSSLCSGSRTKFKFFGVNESGAEFGNTNIPGVLGTDYTWPSPSSIDVSIARMGCQTNCSCECDSSSWRRDSTLSVSRSSWSVSAPQLPVLPGHSILHI